MIAFDLSTTKLLLGISLLIVEPAPMVTCAPILMGATSTEFAPVFE